ncbi:MAG: adenylate kinase family protein [Nitrosopumilus sp.]
MSIVITGNPGVGKHTITQKIAERLNLSIIDINEVAKNAGLFEKTENTNDVDTKKLGKILKDLISEKNIVVGHLAPDVLDKNQVKVIIVLRRNPYDLITVYKERKYTELKIKENTGSEVLGIIAHETKSKFQEKSYQINTSGKNIQEEVEKIISIISSNEGNEEVDWLELVRKNNDFGKFFVD